MSKRGMKWYKPIKDKPWKGEPVKWNEIKDSFPGIHCPEEAIKRTVKRCQKLGLIQPPKNEILTDSEIENLRCRVVRKAKIERAKKNAN